MLKNKRTMLFSLFLFVPLITILFIVDYLFRKIKRFYIIYLTNSIEYYRFQNCDKNKLGKNPDDLPIKLKRLTLWGNIKLL
jgi:hypothetical protein